MSVATLLPCPFCGSTEFDVADDGRFYEWIVCGNCLATGPTAVFGAPVDAWNRRAETTGGRQNDGDTPRPMEMT